MKTIEKLEALRQLMRSAHIDAVIIPGTDPHGSEYIANHWKERDYVSGFTGSAGTVVVTLKAAALWTDSRYFLQANEQLEGSTILLMKDGVIGTPTIPAWLGRELNNKGSVAVNGAMFSVNGYRQLERDLQGEKLVLQSNHDFVAQLWNERPALPEHPIFELPVNYSGKSVGEKLGAVRHKMRRSNVNTILISALDDIAWLFNIRGRDIAYNPVVIAYAIVNLESATLFINSAKVPMDVAHNLAEAEVTLQDYNTIASYLLHLDESTIIGIDYNRTNFALHQSVASKATIKECASPVFKMKSVKNNVELTGIRRAMVKDGVALTRLFMWLDNTLGKEKITELSFAQKALEMRQQQSNFVSESFNTIVGYAGHGAIVHYDATPESDATLQPKGFFLVDSGAQYFDGTTDITRTVALGGLTPQQMADYTMVLKGHIALAKAKFPYGTRGSQLDILARQFLWKNSLNYGHGTGHGIGHFLCVHEGPQSIRMDENPTRLEVGMVLSNEPGIYRANEYGIRIENLIAVSEFEENEFGKFLCFETLTLFPYDINSIDVEMLTESEKRWINNYHENVFEHLSPQLNTEEVAWLKHKTRTI